MVNMGITYFADLEQQELKFAAGSLGPSKASRFLVRLHLRVAARNLYLISGVAKRRWARESAHEACPGRKMWCQLQQKVNGEADAGR